MLARPYRLGNAAEPFAFQALGEALSNAMADARSFIDHGGVELDQACTRPDTLPCVVRTRDSANSDQWEFAAARGAEGF